MSVVFLETPVDVTPTQAGAWQDRDLSAYIPEGAIGVLLHFEEINSSYHCNVGWRKNGSTDARSNFKFLRNSHFWVAVGVDESRICELYVATLAYVKVYLDGYFLSDAVFFTNAPNRSLTSSGSWQDINISADTGADTAVAAIIEVVNNDAWTRYAFGLRKNGSTDNRTQPLWEQAQRGGSAFMGVDENEILEGYVQNTNIKFYLTGYIKAGVSFLTNATDLSLDITDEWADLSALPSGAAGGFIEVVNSYTTDGNFSYALRKKGSALDQYRHVRVHHWAVVEGDSSRVIQGKIARTDTHFFLIGYAEAAGGTETKKLVSINASGALVEIAVTVTPGGTPDLKVLKLDASGRLAEEPLVSANVQAPKPKLVKIDDQGRLQEVQIV